MHCLALYVGGNDDYGRMLRRTLMRYLNLSLILVLRSISSAVKRRFPTMDHIVEAGFMTPLELQMFQAVPNVEFNTYWIPCTWFICLLKEAKKENKNLCDPQGLKIIVEEFNEFRSKCGLLWSYDWISIPLVYTQVVTLATYSFFLAALVGRQYVDTLKKPLQMEIDIYLPVFTILQFFFFMGLLKVAEQLINPFGDDDEDFELNWLIDRHTKVSYLGVDILMRQCPPLVKDKYFDEINLVLPYTGAAFAYKKKTYRGSVHNMQVPEDQQGMFLPEITEEDEDDCQSVKRNTPKNSSFSSLMNATTAGIWRSSLESCNSDCPSVLESGLQHHEVKVNTKIDKNKTHVPWHAAVNPFKHRPPQSVNTHDIHLWSSTSTLESASSNSGLQLHDISNPFDKIFRSNSGNQNKIPTAENSSFMEQKNEHTPESPKQKRSISNSDTIGNSQDVTNLRERIHNHTSSFGSYDKPKLHKLLARRQSSSSGQWKGVRWKPIIDDAAGDTWSDNAERRSSIAVCTNCKQMPLESVDVTKSPPAVPPRSTSLFSNSVDSIASSYQSMCTAASYNEPSTLSKTQSKSFPYFPLANGDDTASVRSSTVSSSLPNILSGSASTINIDSHSQSKYHQDSKTLNENLLVHETKEQLNSNFNNLSNL